jgi:hypothetical protein
MKRKTKGLDEMDATDALIRHLNAATGIVHAAALASLRPSEIIPGTLYFALNAAFEHLEEAGKAREALDDLRMTRHEEAEKQA